MQLLVKSNAQFVGDWAPCDRKALYTAIDVMQSMHCP